MSRASLATDIGERVLEHAILGVVGVYDRLSYMADKRDALIKLARPVKEITRPKQSALEYELLPPWNDQVALLTRIANLRRLSVGHEQHLKRPHI